MSDAQRIRIERSGRLVRLTIDRPPLNVLDITAIHELSDAIATLAAEPEPDVVILQGAGARGFSAGVDIRDHTPERVEEMLRSFHAVFRALAVWDRISLAAVRGVCLGGGFELALACDFLVCEEDARLGFPEIDVGCFPPVAVASLPERIGPKRTADWVLTGRPVTPREAEAAGLVTRIVPKGELDRGADEIVSALLSKSSSVLRITARALREGRRQAFRDNLDSAERFYLNELLRTEDLHEGVASFMEKRQPVWKHR